MTNCPYTGKCTSEGFKCSSCGHNNDAKKDYYQPMNPYYPYNPYPYWIQWDYDVLGSTDGTIVIYSTSTDTSKNIVSDVKMQKKRDCYNKSES
jgi:hypothetical protein